MKILFIDWNALGRDDVLASLKKLGHTVILYPRGDIAKELGFNLEYIEKLSKEILASSIERVFSINYYPSISEACQKTSCKYISWIYDNPYLKAYGINIINEFNYIFTFDHFMYDELIARNVNTIYYAPLAANTERLSEISLSDDEKKQFGAPVSFIGSMYTEKGLFFDTLSENLKANGEDYLLGYIEGLIEAQYHVYGYNFLSEHISDELFATLNKAFRMDLDETSYFANKKTLYCDYILCRKLAAIERKRYLEEISNICETSLYTHNKDIVVGKCVNKGFIDYYTDMPKVFKASKVNLNLSIRSIKTGMPLRAIDIMGAGGFLLTNFQEEFLNYFEPDNDFVYFTSKEEMLDKIAFYTSHDEEREKIARSGFIKIQQEHTYEKRLREMIEVTEEPR